MFTLNQFLLNPAYHDLLSIIKGARNGFVYGCKIRFPHALVMTLLFNPKPWPIKLRAIYTATLTHAKNLAKFVTVYKGLLIIQRRLRSDSDGRVGDRVGGKAIGGGGGRERGLDSFVAGLVGGWWVFGERTAINEQIVLYVSSRVLASFLPRLLSPTASPTSTSTSTSAANPSLIPPNLRPLPSPLPPLTSKQANPRPIPPADTPFAMFAALSWGLVMYVYRHHGEMLQPGMVNSMAYLYRDSETWSNLKTLLWHNK